MNELNDIDNFVNSRQPNELLRIILYGDFSCSLSRAKEITRKV